MLFKRQEEYKRQARELKKTFAKHVSDKRHVFQNT